MPRGFPWPSWAKINLDRKFIFLKKHLRTYCTRWVGLFGKSPWLCIQLRTFGRSFWNNISGWLQLGGHLLYSNHGLGSFLGGEKKEKESNKFINDRSKTFIHSRFELNLVGNCCCYYFSSRLDNYLTRKTSCHTHGYITWELSCWMRDNLRPDM